MPSSPSAHSNDKLYQACLEDCIKRLKRLQISKRSSAPITHNGNNHNNKASPSEVACSSSTTSSSSISQQRQLAGPSLPSPPLSPHYRDTTMNRAMLHGGPPRGSSYSQAPPVPLGHDYQRTPRNLAVQLSADTSKNNLKKVAAKVVGTVGAVPPTAAPTAPATAKPVAEPVRSTSKGEDGYGSLVNPAQGPAISLALAKPVPSITDKNEAEEALDTMFARLSSRTPTASPAPSTTGRRAPPSPGKPFLPIDNSLSKVKSSDMLEAFTADLGKETEEHKSSPALSTEPVVGKQAEDKSTKNAGNEDKLPTTTKAVLHRASGQLPENNVAKAAAAKSTRVSNIRVSTDDLEHQYLRKAVEYLKSFPTEGQAITADLVKNVVIKLGRSPTSAAKLEQEDIEKHRRLYSDAIVTYVTSLNKSRVKPITPDYVQDALKEGDGGFLHLCATLVDDKLLSLENLDEVAGLCKSIMDILPKEVPLETTPRTEVKPVLNDPAESMTAWPPQEKRENIPQSRTCILKGVTSITSVNELQALVWGGRLESISLPEPGSPFAAVRFLTPEACQKYFDATENGIVLPDAKNIFVEKQPGPNSTNDVLRNCIVGDASRCVRAYDAEEGWGAPMLLKLARGRGQQKREVDRVKHGKTPKGRSYIEFRFASIYHALNFKRALMDDEDWEHCTIGYAPDPCEVAQGVHFTDEDEDEKGNDSV